MDGGFLYCLGKLQTDKNNLDYGETILDNNPDTMILELSGNEETVEGTIKILEKYNILELLRSGKMAMISGNDEKNKPKLIKSEPW